MYSKPAVRDESSEARIAPTPGVTTIFNRTLFRRLFTWSSSGPNAKCSAEIHLTDQSGMATSNYQWNSGAASALHPRHYMLA